MKNLIVLMSLAVLTAHGADVVCEKDGKFWYPKSETAIDIAKTLKVKTCNGKRFNKVVKGAGLTTNVPVRVKKLTVKDMIKKYKGKK